MIDCPPMKILVYTYGFASIFYIRHTFDVKKNRLRGKSRRDLI